MSRATRLNRRIVTIVVSTLSAGAATLAMTADPAAAKPTTPVPVCAGAHDLLVDVTQDVLDQPFLPARDGHLWASFSYTQHVRIWAVGVHQYCVRKDTAGTWVSVAGLSPGLTGTVRAGLTGTFTDTTYLEWTGTLSPSAPRSGYLGLVHADCTAVNVCADDRFLVVDTYYFPPGSTQHCNSVRRDLEVDGGELGLISFTVDGGLNKVDVNGDITG
jgi:hypothetical protein